jgi:hypothetical protein
LGSGEITSGDARTSATVKVISTGTESYEAILTNIRVPASGELDVVAASGTFTPGESCFAAGVRVDLGALAGGRSQRFDMIGFATDNPDFIRTIAIARPVGISGRCLSNVLGLSQVKWNVPDMRPNLHVRDLGPRAGASGDVTVQNSVPVAYQVAPGDSLPKIAARFSVQVIDLFYLNPARPTGQADYGAHPGEILNLSKQLR